MARELHREVVEEDAERKGEIKTENDVKIYKFAC